MLPGIRLCCCWSKLWRVSPRWPASNPTPSTPPPCMWSGQGLVLRYGTVNPLRDPAEGGEPFHCLCSWTPPTTTLRSFWGAWAVWQTGERPGCSHKAGKTAALPFPLPQFPISECGGRQTGVTYQHDIVQPRFSRLPQSNENFNCIPLCFFFTYFHRGHRQNTTVHQSMHTHRRQWERVEILTWATSFLPFINIFERQLWGWPVILGEESNKLGRDKKIWEDKWKLSDGVREEEMRGKIGRGEGGESIMREIERGRKIRRERRGGWEDVSQEGNLY